MWVFRDELREVAAKVREGRRLNREDGIALFRSADLTGLGHLANMVRERKHGARVHFVVNRHINHTNICINKCRFCAFSRSRADEDAYTLSLEEIEERARHAGCLGVQELHIVGGLNPALSLAYFEEMLRRVRAVLPGV
ncbi:MAG TPA: radical SAM protein, partial [Desulfotomaculum sp.]|nr:radical SAM protein [Desulfotomaculum sp.]